MDIKNSTPKDAETIATIISQSNRDVAEQFNITIDNCPKHPSFCQTSWVNADFERGEIYFLYQDQGAAVGCVAFESPRPGVAYLNRLSVLPNYRHNGIGESLVRYFFDYAKTQSIHTISIGIIAKHQTLKNWYLNLGFSEGEIKTFPHLPFDVQYMSITI